MGQITRDELVASIARIQAEHAEFSDLLRQVVASVIDQAPDGMTVIYLPVDTLAAIREAVGP